MRCYINSFIGSPSMHSTPILYQAYGNHTSTMSLSFSLHNLRFERMTLDFLRLGQTIQGDKQAFWLMVPDFGPPGGIHFWTMLRKAAHLRAAGK